MNTVPIQRAFLSAQCCCLGASIIALVLAEDSLSDAMLSLSFMFGGAFVGAFAYGKFHGKEEA